MAVSEPTGTGTGTTTEFVLCEKRELENIGNAIREKTDSSEGMTLKEAEVAIKNFNNVLFGTKKWEAGSVIGNNAPHILIPCPEWCTDLENLNFLIYTKESITYDTTYFTVLLKIIRDQITLEGFQMNDSTSLTSNKINVKFSDDKIMLIPSGALYYTLDKEYFYLLWENS